MYKQYLPGVEGKNMMGIHMIYVLHECYVCVRDEEIYSAHVMNLYKHNVYIIILKNAFHVCTVH